MDFVFLHGGGQGGWVWDGVVAALRRRDAEVTALQLEVPGCGAKRGRNTEALSIPEVVAELAAELDAARLETAVLVGHSQAGTVLPALAALRPKAFRRVVHVSTCAPAPGQTVAEMMGRGGHGESPAVVGWPADPATHPFETFARAMFCNDMEEAQAADFVARLGQDAWPAACGAAFRDWTYGARTPATYVLLEKDASLPLEWQLTFAKRHGAERLVRIAAGHQVMQTAPEALADVLMAEAGL